MEHFSVIEIHRFRLVKPGLTDQQISRLPTLRLTNNQIDVHKTCMVCLEDFRLNEKALMLNCFVSE